MSEIAQDLSGTAQAFISAALELLSEGRAFGLREVARRAGRRPMTVYTHFHDVLDLQAAVAAHGFGMLGDSLAAAEEDQGQTSPELVQALARSYVRFAQDRPDLYRMMFGRDLSLILRSTPPGMLHVGRLLAARLRVQGLVERVINQGQQSRALRAGHSDTLALSAWAMLHGVTTLVLDGQLDAVYDDASKQRFPEEAARLLLIGLAAEDAHERIDPSDLIPPDQRRKDSMNTRESSMADGTRPRSRASS